ncbi:hypothetical protein D1007_33315 [Hordeum vulgare]|nr:hypothetical protein D1007_33315 [Hordeum vulgare]
MMFTIDKLGSLQVEELRGSSPDDTTCLPQHNGVQFTDGFEYWDVLPAMVLSLVPLRMDCRRLPSNLATKKQQ